MSARTKRAEVRIAAWSQIGASRFTATSFVVELFASVGIALEDDLLALHRVGLHVSGSQFEVADLIFRTARRNVFPEGDRVHGIGHVGIHVGGNVVIHASPLMGGCIAPSSMQFFLDMSESEDAGKGKYRGARRIIVDS